MSQPQRSWSPPPPPAQKSNTMLIVAVVLLVVVVVAVVAGILFVGFVANRVANTISRQQVVSIVNGVIAVQPGTPSSYQMTIPVGATTIFITGTFTVSGGTGNTVDVLVMDAANYVNWHNGYQSSSYYNSGQVTSGTISAHPTSTGVYYLVYSNTATTTKNVQTTAYLYYLA